MSDLLGDLKSSESVAYVLAHAPYPDNFSTLLKRRNQKHILVGPTMSDFQVWNIVTDLRPGDVLLADIERWLWLGTSLELKKPLWRRLILILVNPDSMLLPELLGALMQTSILNIQGEQRDCLFVSSQIIVWLRKSGPTQRGPDVWDFADLQAFSSLRVFPAPRHCPRPSTRRKCKPLARLRGSAGIKKLTNLWREMKTLVIGTGIIGTTWGWALSNAGINVTHLVRPGNKDRYKNGITLDLLDGRKGHKRENIVKYDLKCVESISASDPYELIIVSVNFNKIDAVLD